MNEFKGPEDSGTVQRTLIAFALTFVVIFAMRYFFPSPQPQKPPQQQQGQQPSTSQPANPATSATGAQVVGAGPSAANQSTSARHGQVRGTPSKAKNAAPVAIREAASEAETTVENDVYKVVFTNRGAQVKSWVLKRYNDDQGKPLELVHPIAAPKYGYPLSLWTYDEGLRNKLNSALYVANTQQSGQNQRTLTFEYSDGQITVRKAGTFDLTPTQPKKQPSPNLYVVKLETSVTQNNAPVQAFPSWPAGFGDQTVPPSYANSLAIYRYQDTTDRKQQKSISSGATITTPMQWAGVADQYFAAVFLPDDPQNAAMVQLRNQIAIPKNLDKPDPNQTVNVDVIGAAVGGKNGATTERLFVGPKALEVLDVIHSTPIAGQAQGPDLEPVVDFGRIFGWLAKPLFIWLEWTHDHWSPNWGWAIVILTVIINVALFPLRLSSMKSMMRMQKIQPQMKALQEKYKKYSMKDPRRADMNKEMQELYKREGVNPVGGCLPMLLQWPFLVAFYSMLGVATELRHANWLWIKDLASPDPYYILPALTIVGMFIVQKMTPQTTGDPMQQKMMLFMMPVFLGWISHALAAGLVLYWVWSNVVSIAQQIWLNNTEFGKQMRHAAAQRAAKPRR